MASLMLAALFAGFKDISAAAAPAAENMPVARSLACPGEPNVPDVLKVMNDKLAQLGIPHALVKGGKYSFAELSSYFDQLNALFNQANTCLATIGTPSLLGATACLPKLLDLFTIVIAIFYECLNGVDETDFSQCQAAIVATTALLVYFLQLVFSLVLGLQVIFSPSAVLVPNLSFVVKSCGLVNLQSLIGSKL